MSATLSPADNSTAPAGPIEATEWYYSRQGVRNGPIPLEEFRRMIEAGELVPEDRVYAEGLGQWAFVHEVKDRLPPKKAAASAPAPAAAAKSGPVATAERAAAAKKGVTKAGPPKAAVAAPKKPAAKKPVAVEESEEGAGTLDYRNPNAELNGRTAEILKGFPTPMGDTETAPLDFEQLDELRVAAGHRKALLRFKILCTVLTLGTFFFVFVPLLLIVLGMSKLIPVGLPKMNGAKNVAYISLGVSAALMFIYQASAAAAHKSRAWGPLVVMAFIIAGAGLSVWRGVAQSQVTFGSLPATIMFGVVCLIWALFIGICVRAIAGAAGFVTSPAWCQEALVYSKL
jgi:hypothetical protein